MKIPIVFRVRRDSSMRPVAPGLASTARGPTTPSTLRVLLGSTVRRVGVKLGNGKSTSFGVFQEESQLHVFNPAGPQVASPVARRQVKQR